MIALKQIVSESAYDGALMAIRPGAVEANVISDINTALAARNVTPLNVTIEGLGGISFDVIDHGEPVTVTVTAMTDGNIVGPNLFGASKTLAGAATAIKP